MVTWVGHFAEKVFDWTARDFDTDQALKIAGILCVFQDLQSDDPGHKDPLLRQKAFQDVSLVRCKLYPEATPWRNT